MGNKQRLTSLGVKTIKRIVSWVLPDIRKLVPEEAPLIEPSPDSPEGMRVPEVIAVNGHPGLHALKLIVVLPYILKTMYYARKCIKSVKKNPPNSKNKSDNEFFKELETHAEKLGISAVGYTEVPKKYIFKNSALLFKNAIVLIMDMDKKKIEKAPA